MRVERTPSSHLPTSLVPPKRAPSRKQDASPQPEERWDGPTVQEREAQAPDAPEERLLHLPGIAQGLTREYLRSRASQSPVTLLAPCLQPTPLSLREFPNQAETGDVLWDYAHNLASQTKALYQRYFPDLFLDLDLVIRAEIGPNNNAGYEWVRGRSRLTLQLNESPSTAPYLAKTKGSLETGHLFRRGITDLVSFVHEYGHATYDALLGVPASADVGCANRSFSEGFAVLLELLTIDHLLQMETRHLYEYDLTDLQERRAQRVRWLQRVLQEPCSQAHLAYAEGTELMTCLHRAVGIPRVLDFVKTVVPNKANGLSRNHPVYRQSIGDPLKMAKLVHQ